MTRDAQIEPTLAVEPPASPDARACRNAYYAELASRFPGGFDLDVAKASRDDGMVPPAGVFLVARLDDAPVGCGGFTRLDLRTAEIKRMWIAPAARGRGLARRLLGELERLAADAGYERVLLDTNGTLTEAQALYRRAGYADVARYNDNPYADLFFEKRLKGASR